MDIFFLEFTGNDDRLALHIQPAQVMAMGAGRGLFLAVAIEIAKIPIAQDQVVFAAEEGDAVGDVVDGVLQPRFESPRQPDVFA